MNQEPKTSCRSEAVSRLGRVLELGLAVGLGFEAMTGSPQSEPSYPRLLRRAVCPFGDSVSSFGDTCCGIVSAK